MRWIPWLLGIGGVAQHAVLAFVKPTDYVSLDMSYLVMGLSLIAAFVTCYMSCGYDCCCDDCGDDCSCCGPSEGHEGHSHGAGDGHSH